MYQVKKKMIKIQEFLSTLKVLYLLFVSINKSYSIILHLNLDTFLVTFAQHWTTTTVFLSFPPPPPVSFVLPPPLHGKHNSSLYYYYVYTTVVLMGVNIIVCVITSLKSTVNRWTEILWRIASLWVRRESL